jgi:ectoine hydroxylase-related dioxygenase (phytanoyl-CoA dioxygenase family)
MTTEPPPISLQQELAEPYPLTDDQKQQFHRDGFIKLKHVLSPEVIDYYGGEITRQVFRLNDQEKPLSERSTYEKAFLQIINLWTKSDIVREFSFSRRLARIAAELMGVSGVRMYHDQALYKEAGGGITPWHADQYYWPLSNDNTVTAWAPLQETPQDMGPLAFSVGSHRFPHGRNIEISDESERVLQTSLKNANYPLSVTPFDLGEVSYHSGWTFHRAGANTTGKARAVMTVIYIDENIRLVQPKNRNQQNDLDNWMPGAQVGEVVATRLNPILWNAED